MFIKMRYEDNFQKLEISADDVGKWLNIRMEDCDSEGQFEQKAQEKVDKQYNRPDYNNCYKFNRHRGFSKKRPNDKINVVDEFEPLIEEVRDPSVYYEQEIDRSNQWEYEALCQKIRETLKPSAADMVIAVALDGLTVGEYAASIGDESNNVSHRYRGAISK